MFSLHNFFYSNSNQPPEEKLASTDKCNEALRDSILQKLKSFQETAPYALNPLGGLSMAKNLVNGTSTKLKECKSQTDFNKIIADFNQSANSIISYSEIFTLSESSFDPIACESFFYTPTPSNLVDFSKLRFNIEREIAAEAAKPKQEATSLVIQI